MWIVFSRRLLAVTLMLLFGICSQSEAFAVSLSDQPLYDDPRIIRWSEAYIDGNHQTLKRMLKAVEADLKSESPHPLAGQVWMETKEGLHDALDARAVWRKFTDSSLMSYIETYGEIRSALAEDHPGDIFSKYPPDDARLVAYADLYAQMSWGAFALNEREIALRYLLEGLTHYPGYFQLAWGLMNKWSQYRTPKFIELIQSFYDANTDWHQKPLGQLVRHILKGPANSHWHDSFQLEPILREWIRVYPRDGRAWTKLGFRMANLSRYDEAVEAHIKGYRFSPFYSNYDEITEGLIRLGVDDESKTREALKYITRIARVLGRYGNTVVQTAEISLAASYRATGDRGSAREILSSLYQSGHRSYSLLYQLGLLEEADGRYPEALERFDEALSKYPERKKTIELEMLDINLSLGNLEEAERLLERRYSETETKPLAYWEKGADIKKQHGNEQAYVTWLNKALALYPQSIDLLVKRAEHNQSLGKRGIVESVLDFEMAFELDPSSARLKLLVDAKKQYFLLKRKSSWRSAYDKWLQERIALYPNQGYLRTERGDVLGLEPDRLEAHYAAILDERPNIHALWSKRLDHWVDKKNWPKAWSVANQYLMVSKRADDLNLLRLAYAHVAWVVESMIINQGQGSGRGADWIREALGHMEGYRKIGSLDIYYRYKVSLLRGLRDKKAAAEAMYQRALLNPDSTDHFHDLVAEYESELGRGKCWSYGYRLVRRSPYEFDKWSSYMHKHVMWGGSPIAVLWAAEEMKRRGLDIANLEEYIGRARGDVGDATSYFTSNYQNASSIGSSDLYVAWYKNAAKKARRGGSNHIVYEFGYDVARIRVRFPNGFEVIREDDLRLGVVKELQSGEAFIKSLWTEDGRWSGIENSQGDKLVITYAEDGQISRFTEADGSYLNFSYNHNGKPDVIESPTSRTTIKYDDEGNILSRDVQPLAVNGHDDEERSSFSANMELMRFFSRLKNAMSVVRKLNEDLSYFPDFFEGEDDTAELVSEFEDLLLEGGSFPSEVKGKIGESWLKLSSILVDKSLLHPKYLAQDLNVTSQFLDFTLAQSNISDVDDYTLDALQHWAKKMSATKPQGLPEDEYIFWKKLKSFALEVLGRDSRFAESSKLKEVLAHTFKLLPGSEWLPYSSLENDGYWRRTDVSSFMPVGIQDARVNQMLLRKNGDLVVASERGLSVRRDGVWTWYGFMKTTGRFSRFAEKRNDASAVNALHELDDGRLVVGMAHGLFLLEKEYSGTLKRWSTSKQGFESPYVSTISELGGRLFIGTADGLTIGNVENGFSRWPASLGYIQRIEASSSSIEKVVDRLIDTKTSLWASDSTYTNKVLSENDNISAGALNLLVNKLTEADGTPSSIESRRGLLASRLSKPFCEMEVDFLFQMLRKNTIDLLGDRARAIWEDDVDNLSKLKAISVLSKQRLNEDFEPEKPGNIYRWKAHASGLTPRFVGNDKAEHQIYAVDVSLDGGLMALGGGSGVIRIYNHRENRFLYELKTSENQVIRALKFLPDGKTLMGAGNGGAVAVWDLESQKQIRVLAKELSEDVITLLDVTKSGNLLAIATRQSGVSVWDIRTGQKVYDSREHSVLSISNVLALSFSRNEQSLVYGDSEGQLEVVDIQTGATLYQEESTSPGAYYSMRTSATSDLVYLITDGGNLEIFDLTTYSKQTFALAESTLYDLELSANERLLYIAAADSTILRFDLIGRRIIDVEELEGNAEVFALTLDPQSGDLVGVGRGKHTESQILSRVTQMLDLLIGEVQKDRGCTFSSDLSSNIKDFQGVLSRNESEALGNIEAWDNDDRVQFLNDFSTFDVRQFVDERRALLKGLKEALNQTVFISSSEGLGVLDEQDVKWLINEPVKDFALSKDGETLVWLTEDKIWQGVYSIEGGLRHRRLISGLEEVRYSKVIYGVDYLEFEGGETLAISTDLGVGFYRNWRVEFMELPLEAQRGALKVGPTSIIQSGEDLWMSTHEGIYAYQPSTIVHSKNVYLSLLTPPGQAYTLAADGDSIDAIFHEDNSIERFKDSSATFLKWDSVNERVITNDGNTIVSIDLEAGETYELFTISDTGADGSSLQSIHVEQDGNVWAASGWTVARYDIKTEEVKEFGFHLDPEAFPSNTDSVSYIYETPSGDVMVVCSNNEHRDHEGAKLYGGLLKWNPDSETFERVQYKDRPAKWFASGYTQLSEKRYIMGTASGFEIRESIGGKEVVVPSAKLDAFRRMHRQTWLGGNGVHFEDDTYLLPSVGGVIVYKDGDWFYPTRLNRILPDDMRSGQYGGREIYSIAKTSGGSVIVASAMGTMVYQVEGGVTGFLVDNNLGHLAFEDAAIDRFSQLSDIFLQNLDPKSEHGQIISRYKTLIGKIDEIEKRLDSGEFSKNPGGVDASSALRQNEASANRLRDRLKREKRARDRLLLRLENEERGLYQLLKVDPQELGAMSSKLPADSIVVQFLPTQERLFIQTVSSHSGVEIKEVNIDAKTLFQVARKAHAGLASLSEGGIRGPPVISGASLVKHTHESVRVDLHWLYEHLLKPVEFTLGQHSQVFIVPFPGPLSYLPFDSLVTRADSKVEYAAEKYKIAVVNSMFHLGLVLEEKTRASSRVLLVGNPDKTLPGAESEVEAIAQMVDEYDSLIRDKATVKALEKLAPSAGILHFATHGMLNHKKPYLSYLVMANGQRLGIMDIGTLSLDEAGVAVLSACETGYGGSGLEFATIARAFVNQSVPTVIASYWKVDDDATKALMTYFYEYLVDKPHQYLDALNYAKIEMIRDSRWVNKPEAWAGFTLFGKP